MSSVNVKEIVYHCRCRRFVEGTPSEPCYCSECGQVHAPYDGSVQNAGRRT